MLHEAWASANSSRNAAIFVILCFNMMSHLDDLLAVAEPALFDAKLLKY